MILKKTVTENVDGEGGGWTENEDGEGGRRTRTERMDGERGRSTSKAGIQPHRCLNLKAARCSGQLGYSIVLLHLNPSFCPVRAVVFFQNLRLFHLIRFR